MIALDPSFDPSAFRARMPVTDRFVFLNHAALAPMSGPAAEVVAEEATRVAATGDLHWPDRQEGVEAARRDAARLLGSDDSSRVAFVHNTSVALSMVAEGLSWKEGDNVVGAACEYPSNIYPWMNLERHGVELRLAPEVDARVPVDEVVALIDDRTRVVALSWVQYATGYRCDLAALAEHCRRRDILLVVDAIQGLGALKLDAEAVGCDVVAAAGHKWMLGPEGIAVLWLGPRAVPRIRPIHAGWRSMAHMFEWDDFKIDWNEGALGQEAGTLNAFGILALGASLKMLLEAGRGAVETRILALTDRLAEGLRRAEFPVHSPWGDAERSGIVSVVHPQRPVDEVTDDLAAQGIRIAHRAGRLRIAPHAYNSEDEIDRVVEALTTR